MRTRTSAFLNLDTKRPEYSFQFQQADMHFCYPRWVYVKRDDGQPMRWDTPQLRDRARSCFTGRRTPERALADLKAMGLHLNQPGQAGAAATTTTTES